MESSTGAIPSRQLRRRDAVQTGHRPRPALASSARGLAKHEMRRQRELEANETFSRANEELEKAKGKKRCSSSPRSSQTTAHSSTLASGQQGEEAHSSMQGVGLQSDPQLGHSQVGSSGSTIPMSRNTIVRSSKRTRSPSDSEGRQDEDVDNLAGPAEASTLITPVARGMVEDAQPAKRKRQDVNIDDEFDDSGYWEDDTDDVDLDWDAIVEQVSSPPKPQTSESVGVFRWAGRKDVVIESEKGKEALRRLQNFWDAGDLDDEVGKSLIGQGDTTTSISRTPLKEHAQINASQSVPATPTNRSSFATPSSQVVAQGAPEHQHENESPLMTPSAGPLGSAATPFKHLLTQASNSYHQPSAVGVGRKLGMTRRSLPGISNPFSTPTMSADANSSRQKAVVQTSDCSAARGLFVGAARRSGLKTAKFKTPFKKGQPLPVSHATQVSPSVRQAATTVSFSSSMTKGGQRQLKAIFDLDSNVSPRCSLAQIAASPHWAWDGCVAYREADECDNIAHILADPHSARRYEFITDDSAYAVEEARSALAKTAGCDEAEVKFEWVRNHYGLIVWKMAAMAFHFSEHVPMFTWDEIVRQLKYRFEREVNRAERSAIKRIQERDSAPQAPLVLCVYDVKIGMQGGLDALLSDGADRFDEDRLYIVLTDGWYRIQALVDAPLARAVAKGHLRQGQKLTIMGASLDASSSACDPLDGFETSPLILHGNGTKLAAWHARLGFTQESCVASLRSLTADGGCAPLMDLIIVRAFPKAYINERRHPNPSSATQEPGSSQTGSQFSVADAWGEEEEQEQHQQWLIKRQQAVEEVQQMLHERSSKLLEIAIMLEDACQNLGSEPSVLEGIDVSSFEGQLDAMLASNNPHSYLGAKSVLPALLSLAQRRLSALDEEGRADFEKLLDARCPTRKCRSFRMLRVRDTATAVDSVQDPNQKRTNAQAVGITLPTGRLRKCRREGLIRVWDVDEMGAAAPQEGCRYRVSNLHPVKPHSWPKVIDDFDDVHLATRRETRWRPMPMPQLD